MAGFLGLPSTTWDLKKVPASLIPAFATYYETMNDNASDSEPEGHTTTSMASKDDIPSSNNASWLSQFVTSHRWPTASLLQTFVSSDGDLSNDKDTPSRLPDLRNDFIYAGSVEVAQNEFSPAPLVSKKKT